MQLVALWLRAPARKIVGESAHRREDRTNPTRSGAHLERGLLLRREAGDQHEHLLADDLVPGGSSTRATTSNVRWPSANLSCTVPFLIP